MPLQPLRYLKKFYFPMVTNYPSFIRKYKSSKALKSYYLKKNDKKNPITECAVKFFLQPSFFLSLIIFFY